jgi:hypothetical protein
MGMFILIQLLLVLLPGYAVPLWLGFGFFGTTAILTYAVLSQVFPAQLSGRCNTALNLLVFIAAFASQWLIGAVIGHWSIDQDGGYQPAGYHAAFLLLIATQLLTAGWYFVAGKCYRS